MHRLLIILLSCGSLAGAITPSQYWRDYYSFSSVGVTGTALPAGSVVTAFDPDGVECGRDTVTLAGAYGYLHIYGDDPLTPEDEGALPGDTITFFVDEVEFIATPVPIWMAGDRSINRVDLFPDQTLLVTGAVLYGASRAGVPGAALALFGPVGGSVTTNATGQFMYGPLIEGRYRIVLRSADASLFSSAITAYDASVILRHLVAGTALPSPLMVADVSGDGMVSAFDASLILQRIVGLRRAFPRTEALWTSADSVEFDHVLGEESRTEFVVQAVGDVTGNWSSGSPRIARGDASLLGERRGEEFLYRLRSGEPVYGLTWEIMGDGELPRVVLPSDWMWSFAQRGDTLKLAAAGGSPLRQDAVVLVSEAPRVVRGMVNEDERIVYHPADGFAGRERHLAVGAAPNPFNPSTRIRIEAHGPGPVEVRIWSVTGQLMFSRTIEGLHSRAQVVWDGTDLRGRDAASGVYLCRVRQGTHRAQTRLLLVR